VDGDVTGGRIKCIGKGFYHVVMTDGKLFCVTHSMRDYQWYVSAGMEHTKETEVGSHPTLTQAKQAIVEDYSKREYADHKLVWYGTKWGITHENGKVKEMWRGTPPKGWKFDFLKFGDYGKSFDD
jgi:hypothetical protein